MQTVDNLYEYESKIPNGKLPSSLNTLTILTFIGGAWQIVKHLSGLAPVDCEKQIATIESQIDAASTGANAEMMEKMMDVVTAYANAACTNHLLIAIVAIVAGIGCLGGAYLMRQRKKLGFTIYAICEMILPILHIVLFTSVPYGWVFCVYMLLAPIIFIALYAANRKYLTD
jgi:hypothetical protein